MLVAIPNEINLGNIPLSQSHTFQVKIQNTSQTEHITPSIKVGCTGCTQANLVNNTIAPGTITTLQIIFTPKARGTQAKMVRLNYTPKGLDQQSLAITFHVNVI